MREDHLRTAKNLLLSLNEEQPDPLNRTDPVQDRFLVDLAAVHVQIALVETVREITHIFGLRSH